MIDSMHESEIGETNSELCFSLTGKALREARRSRGLTQVELADAIDTSQYTISRMELGYEEPSIKIKHRLIDVFTNRTGKLDPLIQNMAKYDPYLTVCDMNGRFLHMSPLFEKRFRIEPNSLLSSAYSEVFTSAFRNEIYGAITPEDTIRLEYEYDLIGIGKLSNIKPHRIHATQMILHSEHGDRLLLSRGRATSATGEAPKLINSFSIKDVIA